MKLYEIPRKSLIRTAEGVLNFHHLDGAYSYCSTEEGDIVHISANTPVKLCDDGVYELL